jgi:predicted TIM-barrel fold metal-dependent hydrolase
MIIDFHAHIRKDHGRPEDLIATMDESGVDKMVLHPIVPTVEGVGSSSNEFVAEVIQRFPDRFIGFACVQPTDQGAPAELERLVQAYGFRGLKLHPPIQQFDLRNPAIVPTLRVAERLRLPVLIHTGPPIWRWRFRTW